MVLSQEEISGGSVSSNIDEKFSVRIRVHRNLRRVQEVFGELVDSPDESFQISIFNKQWFFRQVLASAGDVEILEPTAWRKEIQGAVGQLQSASR